MKRKTIRQRSVAPPLVIIGRLQGILSTSDGASINPKLKDVLDQGLRELLVSVVKAEHEMQAEQPQLTLQTSQKGITFNEQT